MATPIFYNEGYYCSGYGVDTREKARDIAESLRTSPIDGAVLTDTTPATREQLITVHSPDYVDALLTGTPTRIANNNGLGEWSRDLRDSVLLTTGGMVAAVRHALHSRTNAGSLSSGLHHAKRSTGSGFCTVNGLVVAARQALTEGAQRVMIVDFDAHCGGGTASLIAREPRIEQIDVSVSAFDHYQSTDTVRLTMSNGESYLDDIRNSLESVREAASIDVVIYNAGMDPHENCGTGGARGIGTATLAQRERLVFEWAHLHNIPVAFALAGGYSGRTLSRSDLVDLHRLTIRAATL